MKFCVMALPRHRTAWLSNFLTYDGLFCYHEALNGCGSIAEYKSKLIGKGDSNTYLYMMDYKSIIDPDTKVIVIDSDIESTLRYNKAILGHENEEFWIEAKKRLDGVNGLHIDFNDVDDSLHDIWHYITDRPFNEIRANELKKLDIKVNEPYTFKEASAYLLYRENRLLQ